MFKQPLFGEDSSPHRTSTILSAIITLCAWIVFCFMSFFIKFKPKTPEYKEIQIVLSSTPVEEKHEEQSSASAASAVPEPVEGPVVETAATPEIPNPVENPVAEAKVDAPKETPKPAKAQTQPAKQPKQATTAKTTNPSKKVNFDDYQYSTDYSQGVDFNQVTNNKKTTWDDSMFDNSSSEPEPQITPKVEQVTGNKSGMSGNAGGVVQDGVQGQKSQKETDASFTNNNPTHGDLYDSIRNAKGNSEGVGDTSSSNMNQQFSSDLDMVWSGGTSRKQIGKLSINLDSVSKYIRENKITVNIDFTVDEKGYVISGTIIIDRASILDSQVRDAIIKQISTWRFSEAPNRSTATFEYTILRQ